MYKSMEDYDEAAIYYDKALQIYEDVELYEFVHAQTCGKNHKSTLTTLKNLAILYQARADAEGVSFINTVQLQGLDRFEYMLKAEDVLQDIEDRKKSQGYFVLLVCVCLIDSSRGDLSNSFQSCVSTRLLY